MTNEKVLFITLDGKDEVLQVENVTSVSVVGYDENDNKRFIKKDQIMDYIKI